MKPKNTKLKLDKSLVDKCRQFAIDSVDTNLEIIEERGQDIEARDRLITQLTQGKVGEEVTHVVFHPYFPQLTIPDHEVYQKQHKSWAEDLTVPNLDLKIAVKTKLQKHADRWKPSWICEGRDKKIYGPKRDGKNVDPKHYMSMVLIDLEGLTASIEACVQVQWLHDNNLFLPPDRDYLGTKEAVYLDRMIWCLKRKGLTDDGLWQLPID